MSIIALVPVGFSLQENCLPSEDMVHSIVPEPVEPLVPYYFRFNSLNVMAAGMLVKPVTGTRNSRKIPKKYF
jgi:hypothetical protein